MTGTSSVIGPPRRPQRWLDLLCKRARARPMALALVVALLIHALLILNVGFRMPEPGSGSDKTLQITIITETGPAPAREDPNAVAAQQARTGETLVPLPDLDTEAPVATLAAEPQTGPEPTPAAEPPPASEPPPAPPTESVAESPLRPLMPEPEPEPTVASDLLALDTPARAPLTAASLRDSRSAEIARLTSRIEEQGANYASRARRRAISTATREFKYATYMEGWRRKVERIGNLNYPDEAKRLGLYGQLILHVSVRADGSLEAVRVVRSSGHAVLDQAAVRIVELAAPYAPFPPDIRAETDVLDITRTWQFQRNNRLEWDN